MRFLTNLKRSPTDHFRGRVNAAGLYQCLIFKSAYDAAGKRLPDHDGIYLEDWTTPAQEAAIRAILSSGSVSR